VPLYELITDFYAAVIDDYLHTGVYTAIIIVVINWHEMLSYKLHLMPERPCRAGGRRWSCLTEGLINRGVTSQRGARKSVGQTMNRDDGDDRDLCPYNLLKCIRL